MSRSTSSVGTLRLFLFAFLLAFVCAAVGTGVAQEATTTTLSATTPATLGTPATLTATVADTPTPTTAPTGTVSFFDGGVLIGSGTLNSTTAPSVATFTTSILSVGSHTITASYLSNNTASFLGSSTTASVSQIIAPRPTKTALPATGTTPVGSALSITATITDVDPGTNLPVPGAGTFATLTAHTLGNARSDHAAVLLPNGSVLIVGGKDSTGTVIPITDLNNAEIYTPAALPGGGTYAPSTNKLTVARTGHTATLITGCSCAQDGKVLITGGTTDGTFGNAQNSAELYDPAADTFTAIGGTMGSKRFGHSATLLPSGKILIIGGTDDSNTALKTTEVYDPTVGTFSAGIATLTTARSEHTATLLRTGKVLVTGGDGAADAEIVDPAAASTTATANNLTAGALSRHLAVVLSDGLVLITGGTTTGANTGGVTTSELYSPFTNSFTAASSSPLDVARTDATATLLDDGTVYVAAGLDTTGTPTRNDAEGFIPPYDPQGVVSLTSDNGTPGLSGNDTLAGCTLALSGTGAVTCSTSLTPKHVNTGTHNIAAHFLADWLANASYVLNAFILPSAGNAGNFVFQATGAGTSSPTTEPTWLQTPGQTTAADGTVASWLNAGLTGAGNVFSSTDHSSSDSTADAVAVTTIAVTLTAVNDTKAYDSTTTSTQHSSPSPSLLGTDFGTQAFASPHVLGTGNSFTTTVGAKIMNGAIDVSTDYTITAAADVSGSTINPATLAASIIGNPTKTYDGTATATLTSANYSLKGLVGTDSFTVTKTSGTYDHANASTNSTAPATTVTASLAGTDFAADGATQAGDYNLPTTASGQGTINVATVTASIIGNPTKTYDATATATLTSANYSLTGVVAGESFTVTKTTSSYDHANASTNAVTPATTVMASLLGTDFTAGAGTSAGNYNLPTTASGQGTINAKTVTASVIGNPTKTYDGTATATLTSANYSLSGLVSTESFTVTKTTGTYDHANATTNAVTPATTVTASLVGTDFTAGAGTSAGNYNLPTTASGQGTINAATVTGSIVGNPTKAYDATTTATLTSANYSLTGIVTAESFTVTKTTGTYDHANASTNAVTPATTVMASLVGTDFTAGAGTSVGNYNLPTSASGQGTINAKTVTASLIGNPTKTYDGTATATLTSANYSLTGVVAGEAFTVTKTAGTYDHANASTNAVTPATTVTASLAGADFTAGAGTSSGNYNLPTTASGQGTINAATVTASIVGNPTKTYDAMATATLASANYSLTGVVAGESFTVTKTTGTYDHANASTNAVTPATTVTASLAGTDFTAGAGTSAGNYNLPTAASGQGTINAATVTASIIGNPTKTYDAMATATLASANYSLTGVVAGESFTVTKTTGTYDHANASTNAVTPATTVTASLLGTDFTAGAGTSAGNYNLPTTASGQGTINAKTVTASVIGNPTKTYDGTATATLTSANYTLTGVVAGESFTVTKTTGTYDHANASTNAVTPATTVTASLAGADFTPGAGASAGNYNLPTTASGQGTINVAHLTVTADPQSKTYDSKTFTGGGGIFTATITGFVNGETLGTSGVTGTAGFTGNATSAINVGSYTITPTVNTLTAGNYDFTTFNNGTLTINKAPLTITATANSRIYDATRNAVALPTVSGLQGSDTVTGLVETYDTKDVGTGKTLTVIAFTVNDNNGGGNYSTSTVPNTSGVITAKAITESGLLVPASKVYDGTVNASVSGTAVLQTPENAGVGATTDGKPYVGDSVSITGTAVGTYEDLGGNPSKDVATAAQVAFSGLSLQGSQASDYTLTIQSPQAATITQATPTVKIFQGNADVTSATATFTYNAAVQGLTSTVTGVPADPVGSLTISTITYNGGTAPTNAGSYPVVASFNENSNYTAASANATEVINKAAATVKIFDGNTDVTSGTASFAYNAGAQGLTSTVTGVPGEPATLTITGITYAGNSTVPTNAGTYPVVASFSGNGNYNAASAQATEFITKASPTIKIMDGATDVTAGTATFTYNANPQGLTTIVTGVPGEQNPLTVNSLTYTNNPQAPTNAGTYAVLANFNGNGNYNSASVSATEVINQATPTVKILNGSTDVTNGTATFTYTSNPQGLTSSVTGVPGETAAMTVSSLTYNGSNQMPTAFGTYAVVATFSGNNNYGAVTSNATENIGQAALTITAKGANKIYGQNLTFAGNEFTSAGLLGGDSVTSVSLASAGATGTATVTGGPYPIVPSAAVGNGLANYQIAFASGMLSVAPAGLTVTANDRSKVYGQSVTFAGTEFTTSGLLNSDSVTSVMLASNGTPVTATAGSYSITPSAPQGTGLSNYTPTFAAGKLTVTASSLTITANNAAKTYGQNVTFVGNEFTTSGLLNGDTVTSVSLTSNGAAATAGVGGSPYNVTASNPVGNGLSNYSPTFVAGALSVAPAHLNVTANPQSHIFGSALPGLTATLTSFVNGEALGTSGVTGTASCTSAVAVLSPVASYTIACTQGTLSAQNYDFPAANFASGNFVVTQATSQSVVTAPANGSNLAQLMFSAAVSPQFTGIPTGSVTFLDNGSPLGAGASGSSTVALTTGSATFTLNLNQLATGQHKITAAYNGDTNFKAASQVAANITVAAALTTSPGAPIPAQTVQISNSSGQDVTYTGIKCSVMSALGQVVANTLCSVTQSSITVPNNGSASLTLNLATNTASAQPAPSQASLRGLNSLWLAMPAVFFLPLAAPASTRRKLFSRKAITWLGIMLLLGFLLMSMGCGGGGFNNTNQLQPGTGTSTTTQPGSYIVQVTGTGPFGQTALVSIPLSVGF